MKFEQLESKTQQEIYDLTTPVRIPWNHPRENSGRTFPIGAGAYAWTNEALFQLENYFKLDLEGRNMLLVSASGDPFAVFSYLNAGHQTGFDTSHRAILWTELKLTAIKHLNFEDFRAFTALAEEDADVERKCLSEVQKHLSPYALSFFAPLFKKHGSFRKIRNEGNLFRDAGYTGAFPGSNIYCTSESKFAETKEKLTRKKSILIPGTLDDAIGIVDGEYQGFYASNIFDHFNPRCNDIPKLRKCIAPFIQRVDSLLTGKPIMVVQFEWSSYVKQVALETLASLKYEFSSAPEGEGGYGALTVARRK